MNPSNASTESIITTQAGFFSPLLHQLKISFFLRGVSPDARILDIGAGDGWVRRYLKPRGYKGYVSLDLVPPADIVGDIKDWRRLGIKESSFDVIIAFEIVEHVECFTDCYKVLKKGGKMFLTTPVPEMDPFLHAMERLGLLQKRTSPHSNLVNLRDVPLFEKKIWRVLFVSQWAVFTK